LQPYHENFGKRSIKSSKLYFIDVGLASYVLGISEKEQMERDPLRGNLVENLVLLELLKERLNQGWDPQLYFFRDTHGHEVDVVFQSGRHLIPIEIKSSQTFTVDFLNQLKFFHHMVGDRFKEGYVIYNGEKEQSVSDYEIVNFKHASKIVNHKPILKR
jgi:predicted AAA+ superfamily ATPase